jgi:hypothetical protein
MNNPNKAFGAHEKDFRATATAMVGGPQAPRPAGAPLFPPAAVQRKKKGKKMLIFFLKNVATF